MADEKTPGADSEKLLLKNLHYKLKKATHEKKNTSIFTMI